jgi:hypothetical protein
MNGNNSQVINANVQLTNQFQYICLDARVNSMSVYRGLAINALYAGVENNGDECMSHGITFI